MCLVLSRGRSSKRGELAGPSLGGRASGGGARVLRGVPTGGGAAVDDLPVSIFDGVGVSFVRDDAGDGGVGAWAMGEGVGLSPVVAFGDGGGAGLAGMGIVAAGAAGGPGAGAGEGMGGGRVGAFGAQHAAMVGYN